MLESEIISHRFPYLCGVDRKYSKYRHLYIMPHRLWLQLNTPHLTVAYSGVETWKATLYCTLPHLPQKLDPNLNIIKSLNWSQFQSYSIETNKFPLNKQFILRQRVSLALVQAQFVSLHLFIRALFFSLRCLTVLHTIVLILLLFPFVFCFVFYLESLKRNNQKKKQKTKPPFVCTHLL